MAPTAASGIRGVPSDGETARSSPTTASRRGWMERRRAAEVAAVPGMERQLRIQDRAAQALQTAAHPHGALTLETIEARAGV